MDDAWYIMRRARYEEELSDRELILILTQNINVREDDSVSRPAMRTTSHPSQHQRQQHTAHSGRNIQNLTSRKPHTPQHTKRVITDRDLLPSQRAFRRASPLLRTNHGEIVAVASDAPSQTHSRNTNVPLRLSRREAVRGISTNDGVGRVDSVHTAQHPSWQPDVEDVAVRCEDEPRCEDKPRRGFRTLSVILKGLGRVPTALL